MSLDSGAHATKADHATVTREKALVPLGLDVQNLLHLLGEQLWEWNLVKNEMLFTAAFHADLGYQSGGWGNHLDEWLSRIHPADTQQTTLMMRECIQGHTARFVSEHRLRCQDGSWKWVCLRGVVVRKNAQARAVCMQGTVAIIADPHLRAEFSNQATTPNEATDLSLSKQFPKICFFQFQRFSGGHCCLPYASDAINSLHGVSAQEVKDNAIPLFATVHPEDVESLRTSMKQSALSLQVWHLDYRLQALYNERHIFGEAYPTRLGDGSVIWHGFLADVSKSKSLERQSVEAERKKLEMEVKHFENILRSGRDRYKKLASELELMFTHAPLAIMLVHKHEIMRANPQLAQIFGYKDAKEMLGLNIASMHESPSVYQLLRAEIEPQLSVNRVTQIRCSLKRIDGTSFDARLIGRALPSVHFVDTSVWMVETL
ncbi:MAG: PAS domain-containing protein [Undibacterium sp.]|nr:PAS domain-containing protein [Undibacterium sp.]